MIPDEIDRAEALNILISNPSAGMSRIRFKELAVCLSARSVTPGTPMRY